MGNPLKLLGAAGWIVLAVFLGAASIYFTPWAQKHPELMFRVVFYSGVLTVGIAAAWMLCQRSHHATTPESPKLMPPLSQNSVPQELPEEPSKLNVQFAEFKAINGEGEVRNVTEAVKGHVNGSGLAIKIINSELGMREGDDLNFGERKRLTVKYSFDGGPEVIVRRWERDRLILPLDPQLQGLNDLQVKAILIATASLAMLTEIGAKPVPKYTELEINMMPEAQRLVLLRSNDKDYTEACDYHFGGPNVVVGEREAGFEDRAAKKATTRYSFHRPWEAKVKAKYEARFGEDLGHLRKALSGSDLASHFPVADLQEWDVETQIKKISKELWALAFDLGEMNENS